jgi:type VI secretion system protein ImpC
MQHQKEAINMSTGRMQFDMNFGKPGRARPRPDDEQPFRILVLADIAGQAAAPHAEAFARRKPIKVEIDNFDAVFAKLAPRLNLALDGADWSVEFRQLEDFHPDRLFQRLAPFAALRKLRDEINDPAQYQRAALALGVTPQIKQPTAAVTAESDADIERLLGRKPSSEASPVNAAGGSLMGGFNLDNWLRDVVAPHIVPDTADAQRQLLASVDAAIAEQMRRLLHHAIFQELEANWLGIDHLVRNLESSETLELFVMSASRAEMLDDIDNAAVLEHSTLFRCLCGPETELPDAKPWSVIVCDQRVGPSIDSLRLVSALGGMAAQAGAVLLATATPQLVGCLDSAQLVEPKSWQPIDAESNAAWHALRKSPMAASIGIAMPRLLSRLPYGKESDPIASFSFEEIAESRAHEDYLWGNPSFALALLAAQAFQDEGWNMDPDSRLDVADLPSHTFREDGETRQQPCAEVLTSESAGQAIVEQGIMPLLSYRNRNAARLMRWQSIAEPARGLLGPWVSSR